MKAGYPALALSADDAAGQVDAHFTHPIALRKISEGVFYSKKGNCKMDELLRQWVNLWIRLFAVLGVLFLGYVFVTGQGYVALAILGFLVGLGMYWRAESI